MRARNGESAVYGLDLKSTSYTQPLDMFEKTIVNTCCWLGDD